MCVCWVVPVLPFPCVLQMESELEEQSRDNRALQLAMDRQDLRLQASTTDMMKERQKVNSAQPQHTQHTYTRTHTFEFHNATPCASLCVLYACRFKTCVLRSRTSRPACTQPLATSRSPNSSRRALRSCTESTSGTLNRQGHAHMHTVPRTFTHSTSS